MADSCLVASYRRFVDLDEREEGLLAALEKDARDVPKHTRLGQQGKPADAMFVVSSGWCYNEVCDDQGRSQILDIHLPGDLVGLRELAYPHRLSNVHTASDAVICPFPRQRLNDLYTGSARLTAIFVMLNMRREAILSERIFGLGRRDAASRVCHLFLELGYRLNEVEGCEPVSFPCPLNQQQIADALGLTAVHVSRTMKDLRERGLCELRDGMIKLHDVPKLRDVAALNEDYLTIDPVWTSR